MPKITAKEDLTKASVEVVQGPGVTEAGEWQKAAYGQARRANGLRDELTAIRDRINAVLAADARRDDDRD